MGKSWFGTQPASKPYTGPRVEERADIVLTLPGANAIALFTTADGLARWLALPTRFSTHRGGTIDFIEGDTTFGGSYTLLDVPDRVVLVTERHGEIDVRFDFRRAPGHAVVTMTCVASEAREEATLRTRLQETMARLLDALGDGTPARV